MWVMENRIRQVRELKHLSAIKFSWRRLFFVHWRTEPMT
jgi:hypothetical protein